MTDLESSIAISHEFTSKTRKKRLLPSDEIKFMPVLQAKTFNRTVPFAARSDTSEEKEEKI